MRTTLHDLLRCPRCGQPLQGAATDPELICRAERLAYPVADGIPMLLPEHARVLGAEVAGS
jgi:uncharacterized protein YbaR (Trm112 family)